MKREAENEVIIISHWWNVRLRMRLLLSLIDGMRLIMRSLLSLIDGTRLGMRSLLFLIDGTWGWERGHYYLSSMEREAENEVIIIPHWWNVRLGMRLLLSLIDGTWGWEWGHYYLSLMECEAENEVIIIPHWWNVEFTIAHFNFPRFKNMDAGGQLNSLELVCLKALVTACKCHI